MSFERLVDAWNSSREERTEMRHGERVASIEDELGASMTSGRVLHWLLGLDRDEPEQDIDEDEQEQQ